MKDTANTPVPKYRVLVDENFWFNEEEECREHGSFDTLEEATAVAKGIVDEFLATNYKPGMTAEELYEHYTRFGEDPFIKGSQSRCDFSAWKYAESRCAEICGRTPGEPGKNETDIEKPVDENTPAASSNCMDDSVENDRILTEASGFRRLGLLVEAEAALRTVPESDSECYPVAQGGLGELFIAQHRCEDAARLGLAVIAEERHNISVIINTMLALTFLGRIDEARRVLALVEDFGRPLAFHSYQMACFESLSGNFREALRWLDVELRNPRYFKARSIGDSDLLPLWNWLGSELSILEDAHRLLAMPLKAFCTEAVDPRVEILLDENDLKHILEHERRLFRFSFNKRMCELDCSAVAANPGIAEQFIAERRRHIAAIGAMIEKGREQALLIVLNAQPRYAAAQAARGNHLAARWHVTWAVGHRLDMLPRFYEMPGVEPILPLLDGLLAAEGIEQGFCRRMEAVGNLRDVDLDAAWKLLETTPAALRDHPLNQLRWAMLYAKDGDHERAIPIYLRLCELWPNDAVGYANAVGCLMEQQRWDEAKDVFESAPSSYSEFWLHRSQMDNLRERNTKCSAPSPQLFLGQPDLGGVLKSNSEKNLETNPL